MAAESRDVLSRVRDVVADAVKSKVVGPNAEERAAQLFEGPGERWFAEDRPIRVIHGDTCMFVGGLRALLFQSLHPLAMAGVAQHSDYKADPWGRLQRTADFLAATTFGPADQAQGTIDMIKRVHTRVVGTASDGRAYSANDPHLLKWVHIAEVNSFIVAHRTFGATALTDSDYNGYVADMAVIATALGVEDAPRTLDELRVALGEYRPELRSSAEARDAARYLLLTPPLPIVIRPAYGLLAAAAVSLMPAWTRIPLRLPWLPVSERALVRPAGTTLVKTLRWALAPTAPR
ncbi:MAG: DUF2236 domain-containing protein [Actinobacteria bacterium]|nr:DUF2236 domain-containing protein [Actinomycetota bacterium]